MTARGPRRAAAPMLLVALALCFTSCQTMDKALQAVEKVLPYAVVAGGAIASVVAYNYLSDCGNTYAVCSEFTDIDGNTFQEYDQGYVEVALATIGTITSVGKMGADYWVEQREKQRELAELEAVEQQIEEEYAALEAQGEPVQAGGWGNAGAPAAADRWGSAYAQPAYGGGSAVAPSPAPAPTPTAPPNSASSESPWGNRFGDAGVAAKGVAPAEPPGTIALETAILKRVETEDAASLAPVADDDVLYDGIGEDRADRFQVLFSPSRDAFVYVIGVDAVGRLQPLFPTRYPDQANPVRAGERVLLPGGAGGFGLDQYRGIQHVFFRASHERNEALEKQLTLLAAKPAPAPPTEGKVYTVSEPTVAGGGAVQARGITGTGTGAMLRVPAGEGAWSDVPTVTFSAAAPDEAVVGSRYFRHE